MNKKNKFTKELASVFCLKVVLLYVVWLVCFSNPPKITRTDLSNHLVPTQTQSPQQNHFDLIK